jgi:hypothetical protein
MSSIESTVLEIDEAYEKLCKLFEELVKKDPTYVYGGIKPLSEKDILSLIRETMSFQRKIESTNITIQKQNYKKEVDIQRLNGIANQISNRLSSEKTVYGEIDLLNRSGKVVTGVLPQLKEAHLTYLKEDHDRYAESGKFCYTALYGFKMLYPLVIEFEEELRLISALTTYPIEKKSILKSQLVANKFEQVVFSIEEAESNVESEHFKDCVSRCRDAIEFFIASLREKETGQKTEMRFSVDLAKLGQLNVFDEATQKIVQGVYSFLSIKGSHKYDADKITVYDAETALKETYSIIEMLLKKLTEYRKTKANI